MASRIDFDIIHGHSGGPVTLLGWEVARLKRVPFLVTYHTMWNQYTHYILKGRVVKPKMAEVASRMFGNLCDSVIVPTSKVKEELISYGIDKPIAVISNGLRLESFLDNEEGFLRKKYHIRPQTHLILYVGRIGKEKSIDYLLRAFRTIQQEEEDSVFVIVGEGSETAKLKDLAKKLGIAKKVIFTGKIDQKHIAKVYADADLFVFASKSETQGMVLLEAMASGVPIITIHDSAYLDIIKNKKNGFLVDGDPGDFAKTAIRVLRDKPLREKIAEEGRKTVQAYSVDAVASQLEATYKELIAKNSKKIDSPFRHLSKYLIND